MRLEAGVRRVASLREPEVRRQRHGRAVGRSALEACWNVPAVRRPCPNSANTDKAFRVGHPDFEREGHRRVLAGSDTSKSSSGTGLRGLPERGNRRPSSQVSPGGSA